LYKQQKHHSRDCKSAEYTDYYWYWHEQNILVAVCLPVNRLAFNGILSSGCHVVWAVQPGKRAKDDVLAGPARINIAAGVQILS
jgi:hypothetical protein